MRYRIAILDETEYWNKDIVEQTGTIYGVYLYSEEYQVNCCELTPSYELFFLNSVPTNLPDDEQTLETLLDQIQEADWSQATESYYHCSMIDRLPQLNRGQLQVGTLEFNEFENEEDAIEEFHCNPIV